MYRCMYSFVETSESTLAIVGKSGSGKSTIAKILFQFYKPSSDSEISLDDEPLDQLDYDWLRQNMAMVPQDTELFSDTVRYSR